VVRWKNVLRMMVVFGLSRRRPETVKRMLRKAAEPLVPEGFDIDTHLTPTYNPWDQRMCVVPDGDLFSALRDGSASIATERIRAFTETGIELESGEALEADIIVTATGLNLQLFGGTEVVVDGRVVEPRETMTYKSLMLSDVPNLAFSIGYTNASWTLKCDLTAEWVCRILNHMQARGYDICVAQRDPAVGEEPLIDFSSGYVQRALGDLPKQGTEHPWRLHMNYARDIVMLRRGQIEDGTLRFSRRPAAGDGPAREPERLVTNA
jgi:cation diffusion facilitator CzcD-associated flavoprotein CzcO